MRLYLEDIRETYENTTLTRSLFWPEIMSLVRNIIANSHLQRGVEQSAVRHGGCSIPDLDNVEVAFGRDSDSCNAIIVALQEGLRHRMNHTIHKHCVSIVCVHLLGPRTTLIIFRGVPQRAESLFHQEEHA